MVVELEHLKIKTRLIDEKFVKQYVFIITGKARAKENTYKWVSV